MDYREPTLFAETDRFDIKASIHENGLSIEFRLYESGEDDPDTWDYGGALKWDGCLNWQTNPACLAHYCRLADHVALGVAFEKVGEMAREHVRGYEGEFGTSGIPVFATTEGPKETFQGKMK